MTHAAFKNQVHEIHSEEEEKRKKIEVLYQQLGNRWYAFSVINDEVYMGCVNQNNPTETDQLSHGKR